MVESLAPYLEWVKQWLLALHPESLFALSFIEAIFFPIPPDFVLIPLALFNPAAAPLFATLATVGSVLGATVGYAIGRWGGRPVLERFASGPRMEQVEALLQRYDAWAIGIAGFTPVPYKVFAVAAGVFHLSFSRFVIVSFISRGARFMMVAVLLMYFGEAVETFLLHHFGWFTLALVGVLAVAYIVITRRKVSIGR